MEGCVIAASSLNSNRASSLCCGEAEDHAISLAQTMGRLDVQASNASGKGVVEGKSVCRVPSLVVCERTIAVWTADNSPWPRRPILR